MCMVPGVVITIVLCEAHLTSYTDLILTTTYLLCHGCSETTLV